MGDGGNPAVGARVALRVRRLYELIYVSCCEGNGSWVGSHGGCLSGCEDLCPRFCVFVF